MDTSIKLHDACIRQLAAKHKGYESVWEGDSFIIAFAEPLNALEFSMALQKALLGLDWPAQLLEHVNAREVWMRQRRGKGDNNRPLAEDAISTLAAQVKPASIAGRSWITARPSSTGNSGASATGFSRPPTFPLQATTSDRGFALVGQTSLGSQMPRISILAEPELAPSQQRLNVPHLSVQLEGDDVDDERAHDEELFDADNGPASTINGLHPLDSQWLPDRTSCHSSELAPDGYTAPMFGGVRPSMAGTALSGSFTAAVNDLGLQARMWTMRLAWRQKWAHCNGNVDSRAVLAHRGLRVRVGFHAGLDSAADLSYNRSSRRHIYTGARDGSPRACFAQGALACQKARPPAVCSVPPVPPFRPQARSASGPTPWRQPAPAATP